MCRQSVWVAALVALAILGAGCSKAQNDNQITTDVKARMFSDSQLKATQLNVVVKEGVATVSGQVPSVAARYEAFKVASETPGVTHVNDQMVVEEPPAPVAATAANTRTAPAPSVERAPSRPHIKSHHPTRQTEAADEDENQPVTADQTSPPPDQSAQPDNPTPPEPPPAAVPASSVPPPPQRIEVPAGAPVNVRMIDSIDSAANHTGEIFHAALESPIVVNGQVVAPRGADVYVRLVQAQSAGRLSGQSELRLELYRMQLDGKSYPLVSSDYDLKGKARGKRSAETILGAAAVGAVIGAIAGGGKGAAIGAGVGGGGGTVYQDATKGQQVRIPSETVLNFQLSEPVNVTVTPSPAQQQPNP